jgi:hypothetical protein
MKNADSGDRVDPTKHQHQDPKVSRLATNLADLLLELLDEMNKVAARSEPKRKKVLVDLRAVLKQVDERDQGVILTQLRHDVQRQLDSRGSPKVTVSGGSTGCVGRPGGGVNATEGGVTVGVCAVVDGVKPIGGGVQGSVSY